MKSCHFRRCCCCCSCRGCDFCCVALAISCIVLFGLKFKIRKAIYEERVTHNTVDIYITEIANNDQNQHHLEIWLLVFFFFFHGSFGLFLVSLRCIRELLVSLGLDCSWILFCCGFSSCVMIFHELQTFLPHISACPR